MRKSKKNVNKLVIALIVVVIVIAAVFAYKSFGNTKLNGFYVNQSSFVVEASDMQKVEIFVEKEREPEPKKLGEMEIVEKDADNKQTWIMDVHKTNINQVITNIYAQGTTIDGKVTKRLSLPYKTPEEFTRVLRIGDTPQAVLFGTVNSVTGNILSLNILASTTIRVTLVPDVVVTNKAGQEILPSQLIRGGLVSVTGDFTDETSFTAAEVAEENPQL